MKAYWLVECKGLNLKWCDTSFSYLEDVVYGICFYNHSVDNKNCNKDSVRYFHDYWYIRIFFCNVLSGIIPVIINSGTNCVQYLKRGNKTGIKLCMRCFSTVERILHIPRFKRQ